MLLVFSKFLFPPLREGMAGYLREGMAGHLDDMVFVLSWISDLTVGFHFKKDSQVYYCQQ